MTIEQLGTIMILVLIVMVGSFVISLRPDQWLVAAWDRYVEAHPLRDGSLLAGVGDHRTMSSYENVEDFASDMDAENTSIDTDTTSINTASNATRHLTERDTVILLAAQKDGTKWRHSGNKIFTFIGGNRNDVMKMIADVRGERMEVEIPAAPAALPLTPYGGTPYDPTHYYQDTPELQYTPPTT